MVDIRFVPIFGWFLSISHKPRLRPHYIIVVQENNFPLDFDFVRWLFSSATLSFYAFSTEMISLSFAIIFSQTVFDRSLVRLLVRSVFIFDRFFVRSLVPASARLIVCLFVLSFMFCLILSLCSRQVVWILDVRSVFLWEKLILMLQNTSNR